VKIWNKHKILRFLEPILTYWRKKFSNRSIWVSKCAESFDDSKSEDELKKQCTNKNYFKKTNKKAV